MTEQANEPTDQASSAKNDDSSTFSILRRGATEPGGPYSEEQILKMLQEDTISRKDFVYFDGMTDWRPIEDVFEIEETINHLVDDGQNPDEAAAAFREVNLVTDDNEEVYYIAIQARAGLLTKTKQCLVVTDQFLYHLTEKGVGYELEAHDWAQISNSKMQDNQKDMGTFSFTINQDRRVDVPHLPMPQVKRLFELACEMKS